ncbi:MAG TPA: lipopolysaccharide kinase InaA family protein, partial [Planctomycetota bacterium]|nr:lipopolysaccharide kinase InaA family protein [Planctomycetota bacterium]
ELARAGVRVPKPVAWFQSDADSLLMMDRVPAESDLRQILTEDPKAWARFRRPLLALVVGLHGPARGTERFHRDLYLQHILVEVGTEQLWLIDVGRVGLGPKVRQRWLEKDLAALAHSAPASLGHTERLAWLGRYLTLRLGSLPRREHRARLMRWARAIDTRRARMARHRPRFGETGPMGG